MTFDHFKELTDHMISHATKLGRAYDNGIDLYEFTDETETLIHKLWNLILTDHGLDWFSWFMYEKNYIHDGIGNSLTASDDDKPICEDLQGLYDYLVENNYFKIPVEDAKTRN